MEIKEEVTEQGFSLQCHNDCQSGCSYTEYPVNSFSEAFMGCWPRHGTQTCLDLTSWGRKAVLFFVSSHSSEEANTVGAGSLSRDLPTKAFL